jgi:Rieske 2Fe-2S family protein
VKSAARITSRDIPSLAPYHNRMKWQRILDAHRDGCGLPRECYFSDELYAAEMAAIWRRGWLLAGLTCELPEPGSFFTLTVDGDPLLVLRDDGGVRAFHNVCTHRGTLLCPEPAGKVGHVIVCPYHQWTFTRQGELYSRRGMHAGLDTTTLGLAPVAVETVAGLIFVCLAETPEDFAPARAVLAAAELHDFERAKVARQIDYEVRANWKLVWENNRECYHCDANHPEYCRSNFDVAEDLPAESAAGKRLADIAARSEAFWKREGLSVKHTQGGLAAFPDPEGRVWYSATRTVLADGFETESIDGRRVAPLLGDCGGPEAGVLRLRTLPNFWCHVSCDHAVLTRLFPAGLHATRVRVTWLVDGRAREGEDYQLDELLPFWQRVSEQDWRLCELAQQGVSSTAYRPGPLSRLREYNLLAFFRWYLRRMGRP